ncbi:MAG: four-carbon acid sugar kinase family protein [Rhodothermales bacterium]
MQRKNRDTLLAAMPPPWTGDALGHVQEMVQALDRTIVVIDDDPTGTQTVANIPVLTEWSEQSIAQEFRNKTPLFFILTNARSVSGDRAKTIAREVGESLLSAAISTNRRFNVVSRSDSTLRGHYPAEVDALTDVLGVDDAVRVVIPFFEEGGRLTIQDVHWVDEEGVLVPVGETPFAQDASFGFSSSNLRNWVEEKTAGEVPADTVASLSIEDIRTGGPEVVRDILLALPKGSVCIANAINMTDLEVVTLGCLMAEKEGQQLLYRTAASFVRTYAGQNLHPLLIAEDLNLPDEGAGLIVVGSHVPMSTHQLNHILQNADVTARVNAVELNVSALLNADTRAGEIVEATFNVQESLRKGIDTVLYTSRKLATGTSATHSLEIAGIVSRSLVAVVANLEVRPRYIVAKGGITSSDVATRSLGVKRAMVLGQIIPGVPVNRLGDESRFPGLVYVVFPGNVGRSDALTNVVRSLSRK